MTSGTAAFELPAALGVRRLLLVGTGAAAVAHIPALVQVLKHDHAVDVAVALTGAAWPDLLVAGLMSGLFLSSSVQILRQALAERREAAMA